MSDYTLSKGSHPSPEQGRCAMEWICFLSGEPHSDNPSTVSPLMRSLMMMLNDFLDDESRQKLRPYLARCIHTRDDGKEYARERIARDWAYQYASGYDMNMIGYYVRVHGFSPEVGELLDELLTCEPIPMPTEEELLVVPYAIEFSDMLKTKYVSDNYWSTSSVNTGGTFKDCVKLAPASFVPFPPLAATYGPPQAYAAPVTA